MREALVCLANKRDMTIALGYASSRSGNASAYVIFFLVLTVFITVLFPQLSRAYALSLIQKGSDREMRLSSFI